jgi:hypothetical protein
MLIPLLIFLLRECEWYAEGCAFVPVPGRVALELLGAVDPWVWVSMSLPWMCRKKRGKEGMQPTRMVPQYSIILGGG